MNVTRLQSSQHPHSPAVEHLYRSAFPLYEQRTRSHQEKAFTAENYFLLCYSTPNQFIGFIAYWDFEDYRYIEHFAISPEVREQGYGSRLLRELLDKTDKTVILEIDPVVDAVSQKRLRFYQSLGFIENAYPHVHPPYQPPFDGHALRVLSSRALSVASYQQFNADLVNIVMAR